MPPQCLPAISSSVPQSSIAPTVTTSVPAGGPELRITTLSLVHLFDAHGRTYVGQRPDDREDPGLAFLVINEGGVVQADVGAVGLDESGLELNAVLGLFSEDDPRRLVWACRLQMSRLVGLGQGHFDLGAAGQRGCGRDGDDEA